MLRTPVGMNARTASKTSRHTGSHSSSDGGGGSGGSTSGSTSSDAVMQESTSNAPTLKYVDAMTFLSWKSASCCCCCCWRRREAMIFLSRKSASCCCWRRRFAASGLSRAGLLLCLLPPPPSIDARGESRGSLVAALLDVVIRSEVSRAGGGIACHPRGKRAA
jgi:hypothetical protein